MASGNIFDCDGLPECLKHEPTASDILSAGGMVEKMARHVYDSAKRPQPWFAIGSALAFLGALFGRKIRTSDGNRSNLYVLLLGEAGCGKNDPQTFPQDVAHMSMADDLISGEVTSDAALNALLEENPSRLLILDEIGHFFEAAKAGAKSGGPVGSVIGALLRLATSAHTVFHGKSYANRRERPSATIDQPCVSFIGSTTPAQMFGTLDAKDIETGFLPRIPVFPSVNAKLRNIDVAPIPQDMIEYVKNWTSYKRDEQCANYKDPTPSVIPYSEKSNSRLWAFSERCEETREKAQANEDPTACIWGRTAEMARRISLILAASRYAPDQLDGAEITEADAMYAIWLTDFITRQTCKQISSSLFRTSSERDKQKILSIIKSKGKQGINQRELTRKTQWVRDTRTRNNYVGDLVVAELIHAETVGKTTCYYAC